MPQRIEFTCDVVDCYICDVGAGRCDDGCRTCYTFTAIFGFAPTARCLDTCDCYDCSARRRGVRDDIGRDVDGATGEISGIG